MTHQDKLQKIRKACIEANPDIVERGSWEDWDGNPQLYPETIRLADVLLAMNEKLEANDFSMGAWRDIVTGEKWNLRKDNLSEQSEETINFLDKIFP